MDKHNIENRPSHTMKWHNFLIYFSLWLSAILNILSSAVYFNYLTADSFRSYNYTFGGLMFACAASAICAIYAIVVRFKLARYKVNAPGHLMAYQITVMILNIIIGSMESSFSFSTLIANIAAIIINAVYYSKRSDLFVC